MLPGVYDYYTGNHASRYVALRHTPSILASWYLDPAHPEMPGVFRVGTGMGMNIHSGGNNRSATESAAHSQGCSLVRFSDYVAFELQRVF